MNWIISILDLISLRLYDVGRVEMSIQSGRVTIPWWFFIDEVTEDEVTDDEVTATEAMFSL